MKVSLTCVNYTKSKQFGRWSMYLRVKDNVIKLEKNAQIWMIFKVHEFVDTLSFWIVSSSCVLLKSICYGRTQCANCNIYRAFFVKANEKPEQSTVVLFLEEWHFSCTISQKSKNICRDFFESSRNMQEYQRKKYVKSIHFN